MQVTARTRQQGQSVIDFLERGVVQDRQTLLETLRGELAFIESGGYRKSTHAQWRPQLIFEDSPTCLNHDPTQPRKPCNECLLMTLVPKEFSERRVPCRYIPLNARGETLDLFYRTGTREELEAAVVTWLRATIEQLEREKEQTTATGTPNAHVKAKWVSGSEPT